MMSKSLAFVYGNAHEIPQCCTKPLTNSEKKWHSDLQSNASKYAMIFLFFCDTISSCSTKVINLHSWIYRHWHCWDLSALFSLPRQRVGPEVSRGRHPTHCQVTKVRTVFSPSQAQSRLKQNYVKMRGPPWGGHERNEALKGSAKGS